MGFRGEALSAISSVSKFTLMTCEENQVGTKLVCLNSEVVRIEPCALTRGTIIQVEELFYNTPARLKYLKADSSEFSAILDITNKLALAHPKISFSLYSNQKLMFQTSGKDDIIEILSEILKNKRMILKFMAIPVLFLFLNQIVIVFLRMSMAVILKIKV